MIKANLRLALLWSLIILGVGFATPSAVIFYLEVAVGNIDPATAAAHTISRQFAKGNNLFLLALFGLIPFAVLATLVSFMGAFGRNRVRMACVALGGVLGILGLMIPAHVSVWYPHYAREHMSSTAVVAFVFIPFWCLGSMIAGLVAGWLVSLLPVFRAYRPVG